MSDSRSIKRAADPVTRLHNICQAIEDPPAGSPYSKEAFELADSVNVQQQQEIKRLNTRLEAGERDGARYRWLCQDDTRGHLLYLFGKLYDCPKEELDAAIDAQIAARKE